MCPESCLSCEQNSGDCIRCAAGYFGLSCKEQCPTGCAPSLGCNADSGCVQCRLGWDGKWCKQFTQSCDDGRFRGTNCKDQCPENCEACNGTQVNEHCLVCKKVFQWQLCADVGKIFFRSDIEGAFDDFFLESIYRAEKTLILKI